MVVVVLLFLFSALSRVESSTVFALEAKPLELNILGDEHCEYGLSRRRPYKWCICWGKIGIRVEVLPWDCTTRAPIGLRRKRTNILSEPLRPRKPLSFGNWEIPVPQEKLDSLLEKAGTSMLKEIVESESGDSLLAGVLRQLLVPYLRSYIDPSYRKPSLVSRVLSGLKFLLSELDNPKNMMELEHYLWELKNFMITALEERLVILKGTSDKSQETANKGHSWELVENEELAPKDSQKRADVSQAGSTSTQPEEKISFVSVSEEDSYRSKMLGTNKTLSKLVDDRLVKAILINALASQIAQILRPAVESNAGLRSSQNLSDGTKNDIKTEFSNTQAGIDDKIPSDQAWLPRNGLALSRIGKILLPRRPTPDVISRDIVDPAASRINNFHSGQVGKISVLKTDNLPQDLGNVPDSVLGSLANRSKSSEVEDGNSLTVKINRSSSQTDLHTEQFGNHIHRNILIIPELSERSDSSLGNSATSSESSKFETSSGFKLNLSTSRTDTNPDKREDQTQKPMNSSELTRQNGSAMDNSGTRSETSKLGLLSDSKHEGLGDINQTLMNSPKLTSSAVSTHENVDNDSRILKLENASIPTISRYHTSVNF